MKQLLLLSASLLLTINSQTSGAENPAPALSSKPPQFIVLGVDDCHTCKGLDGLIEIMDAVRAKGGRPIVYALFIAPAPDYGVAKEDLAKAVQRLQLMYDRGVELGNHSLNHTAGGGAVHPFESEAERFMEKAQCNIWLRENIRGLDKIYGYRTDREFLDRLNGEYLAHDVPNIKTAVFGTWRWPRKLEGMECIWNFNYNAVDLTAPPFHPESTRAIASDWGIGGVHGFGKLTVAEAVEMLKANFAAHYNSPERTPFSFSIHDFNFQEYDADDVWAGCEHEKEIWKTFLTDVFVTDKDKYPDAYCITPHQLFVYMNTKDLRKTLAEGNGQKLKPGEVLKTPEEPSRELYRTFRSTFNKQWTVAGPFDNSSKKTIAASDIAPRQWARVTLPEDDVMLWLGKRYAPTTTVYAYSRVYVQSPVNQVADVRIRGAFDAGAFTIWMNNQVAATGDHQYITRVDLKQGWNELLIKTGSMHRGTINSRYEWYFNCRITDTNGIPLNDIVYGANPGEKHNDDHGR